MSQVEEAIERGGMSNPLHTMKLFESRVSAYFTPENIPNGSIEMSPYAAP